MLRVARSGWVRAMTDVLILGGTGWLSGRIAAAWLDAGAAVTCLARGGRPSPDGTRLVAADRGGSEPYADVVDRAWDEVVDVSSNPAHVAAAVRALSGSARHWTYISSISVYARADVVGGDESVELLTPAGPDDESDYGRDKAEAEASVRHALGDRAAIIRPGLIVGPGDPTDRFGYWVGRFARAGAEPVLVPAAVDAHVQVIDVDELAAFAVAAARGGWAGTVNAIGDVHPLDEVLALARMVAGHAGDVVAADPGPLSDEGVAHWAGPRSLPLWLPADMPGFMTWRNDRYRAAGGMLRPLRETLERTLADERVRGLDRERRAGLTRAEELALIASLRS